MFSWFLSPRCLLAVPLAAAACAYAEGPIAVPLLNSCEPGAGTIATVRGSDPVDVRWSFATDTGTCYAVAATVDGKSVNGYLTGGTPTANDPAHPAIASFLQEIRAHISEIPLPPSAEVPAAVPANQPVVSKEAAPRKDQEDIPPLSFAGFRAVDIKGNRVDLISRTAPNIVVYFWSALDQRGIKQAEAMYNVYEEFHTRGVDVVGVASARNATQLRQICTDNEVEWPEILDSGGIAGRYRVDPAKPYLLLDQSRKVVAAVGSPRELEPILRQLTQLRRVNR